MIPGEMNGPGVAFECTEQNGMHLWEDCYLVEIINPGAPKNYLMAVIFSLVFIPIILYAMGLMTRVLKPSDPFEGMDDDAKQTLSD